jgi:nucleoside recognition membrane protein YjiH
MMPGVEVAPGVIVSSVALMALTAFVLRTRVPAAVGVLLLAVAGGAFAWGVLLLQPDPSVGESVAAVALLSVLTPAHVRIVLGPYGPVARGAPIRALAAPGERR